MFGEKKKPGDIRGIIASVVVIVFFLVIIIVYYNMLRDETESNMIKEGGLNAGISAEKLNGYLSVGMDCISLTGYTLDNMLLGERGAEELLAYLVDQSFAISNIMPESTTGVYGYFDGEYLDGSGWEPDKDYVPTERPWYLQAKEGAGKVVVVDPYIDAQTGVLTITLAKLLCDAKSVVAVDVTMQKLQDIVEELTRKDGSGLEIVLDNNYHVLAHPDHGEIGKDYLKEEDTLGSAVIKEHGKVSEKDFSFTFHDTEYVVSSMTLNNGWLCLSVIDTTADYKSLRSRLVLTVLAASFFLAGFLGIMFYSGRKRIAAARSEEEKERAVAASEAKTAFLSNMSHEIRTPINAVLGMNEMILRECEDPVILQYAESVRTSGNTLLGLINDILDFSKIEAGKIEILPVDYHLCTVLNDLVNMIKPRAAEKGLSLVLDFDQNIPEQLHGDEVRIKQIITNILTNAVKYTEKGSITFQIGFEKTESEPDHILIHVSVRDSGIGIRAEDMEKLFLEFERIEEKRNRNIEGTGLGMSITKNLLEMMGTSLQVESTYGLGSRFFFTLKQRVVSWEPLGDYEEACRELYKVHEKHQGKFTAPDALVLVVDDNEMNLVVFESLLKSTRVKIETADSGEKALKLTQKKTYDLLFFDHMMPEKDGIETLHEMRMQKENPNLNTPVICLTANAISGAREEYIREGFDDYLTKPIDSGKLEDILLTYLPEEKIKAAPKMRKTEEKGSTESAFGFPEEFLPLSGLELIDVRQGIENSGSKEAYLSLLKIFYGALEEKAEEIEELFGSGDIKGYTLKVHALKSSARIIGAAIFGEEAQKLEDAGKREDMEYIREHQERFMQDLRRFKAPLSEMFPEEEKEKNPDRPEADKTLMEVMFDEIKLAAEDMDCDRLESIFSEMEDYAIPEPDAERFAMLKEKAGRFDYEGMMDILRS